MEGNSGPSVITCHSTQQAHVYALQIKMVKKEREKAKRLSDHTPEKGAFKVAKKDGVKNEPASMDTANDGEQPLAMDLFDSEEIPTSPSIFGGAK